MIPSSVITFSIKVNLKLRPVPFNLWFIVRIGGEIKSALTNQSGERFLNGAIDMCD
jgi:hypothetical protein